MRARLTYQLPKKVCLVYLVFLLPSSYAGSSLEESSSESRKINPKPKLRGKSFSISLAKSLRHCFCSRFYTNIAFFLLEPAYMHWLSWSQQILNSVKSVLVKFATLFSRNNVCRVSRLFVCVQRTICKTNIAASKQAPAITQGEVTVNLVGNDWSSKRASWFCFSRRSHMKGTPAEKSNTPQSSLVQHAPKLQLCPTVGHLHMQTTHLQRVCAAPHISPLALWQRS